MNYSKNLSYYLAITFGLSIAMAALVKTIDPSQIQFIRISAMFIPLIGVMIMANVFKSPVESMGWRRFPVKWIFPALLIIPLAIHLINLPLVAFLNGGQIPWQDWLYADSLGIYHSPNSKGWGDLNSANLIKRIAINALVGVSIVSVLAFFEEVGWRAWMLPRLMNLWGVRKGILVSAIVWAAWHIPFVFGGINVIPGISLTAMTILYPIGLVGAGIVLGWLWHRSKSIWIVCLAHGALNNWGQYAFKYMKDGPAEPSAWPWLYTGVNASMILAGFIILLSIKPNSSK